MGKDDSSNQLWIQKMFFLIIVKTLQFVHNARARIVGYTKTHHKVNHSIKLK